MRFVPAAVKGEEAREAGGGVQLDELGADLVLEGDPDPLYSPRSFPDARVRT